MSAHQAAAIPGGARVDTDAGAALDWSHRAWVEPLLRARWADEAPEQRLSDPWFGNLMLFRDAHDWRVRPGDWPTLTGRAYDGARLVLPLFDLPRAPARMQRHLLAGHDAFGPLSTAQAHALDPGVFALHEVRDDADYLYPAERFEFAGAALHGQRNLVRQLLRAHRLEAVAYGPALAAQARDVLQGWMRCQPGQARPPQLRPCHSCHGRYLRIGCSGRRENRRTAGPTPRARGRTRSRSPALPRALSPRHRQAH